MTKESSTTIEPATEATPPAASNGEAAAAGPPATTESGATSAETTGERATAMRATLRARRDAESLLAEASALRRTAASDADAMVADAETLAEQLLAESRQTAERTTVEAQERADGILARARVEAAELRLDAGAEAQEVRASAKAEAEELRASSEVERRKMRAEVTVEVERASRAQLEELQVKSDLLLRQVELGIHGLGPALEGAMTVVGDVIGSLERLRSVTPGEAPDFARLQEALDAVQLPESATGAELVVAAPRAAPLDGPASSDSVEVAVATEPGVALTEDPVPDAAPGPRTLAASHGDDTGARPLGWLFRAAQS